MRVAIAFCLFAAALPSSVAVAQETPLFNGNNLQGWTFLKDESEEAQAEEPWQVDGGRLVTFGLVSGYLIHEAEHENCVLEFEIRTMSTEEGGGMAVGSLGSVYVNAAPEISDFGQQLKSIEIDLRDDGDVYFRDIDSDTFFNHQDRWVYRAPDFAEDVDREMGEWNEVKLICNGARLTVIMNGRVINQVHPLNRTKGAFAIRSSRGFVAAPTFYRDITVRPIGPADLAQEKRATAALAQVKEAIAVRQAAEEARRAAEERRRMEEEELQREQQRMATRKFSMHVEGLEQLPPIEFVPEVRRLPFPRDTRKIEFSDNFEEVEFKTSMPLDQLSAFYFLEMTRRGWEMTDNDIEDDEIDITFKHGDAEVEIEMEESSKGVEVSIECEELDFDGTDDPAALVALGVPQPQGYLLLQRELVAPPDCRDHEYDDGKRRLFKSTMQLEELYAFLTDQLRQKGYREARRPIITDDRNYSVFKKGSVKIGVNAFEHPIGSRVVLTVE